MTNRPNNTGIALIIERVLTVAILSVAGLIVSVPLAYLVGFLLKCITKLFSYGFNLWT